MRTKWLSIIIFIICAKFGGAQEGIFTRMKHPDLKGKNIHHILAKSPNDIFLATDLGLYHISSVQANAEPVLIKESKFISFKKIVSNNAESIVLLSNEGKLYTYENTFFRAWQNPIPHSLILLDIIYNYPKNSWIGLDEKGRLFEWDKKIFTQINFIDSTDAQLIMLPGSEKEAFVYEKPNNKNELKTYLSASVLNQNLKIPYTSEGASQYKSLLSIGSNQWLLAKDFELIHFDNKGLLARKFVGKKITYTFSDFEGKLWVSKQDGGVLCFPTGDIGSRIFIEYLNKASIECIAQDVDGTLYFGSKNEGIYMLESEPSLQYDAPKVFSSNDSGKQEMVLQTKIKKPKNLQLEEEAIRIKDTLPPNIFITSVFINGKDTAVLDEFNLPHNANYISFHFTGYSKNNSLVQYKYKLEGIDKEWNYTASNRINYNTLPPGKYQFSVSAMNLDGLWSKKEAKIKINIAQPFYQTWWFYLITGFGFITLTLLLVRLYIQFIKKREAEKIDLLQKISQLELQGLRSQMNPHFLFNTLSSIQHFITTNETKDALRYLSKFSKLMRLIMNNSQKQVISVEEEINSLSLYLELESLRFKNKFTYKIELDENFDTKFHKMPSMLIQPYIENAILHGLLHKEGNDGQLTLRIKKEARLLICEIEDNGIGREASMKMKSRAKKEHESKGMQITKDRLEILNKKEKSNLSVEIIDLKSNSEASLGTIVRIFVPI